jgi:hypothetical protein
MRRKEKKKRKKEKKSKIEIFHKNTIKSLKISLLKEIKCYWYFKSNRPSVIFKVSHPVCFMVQ